VGPAATGSAACAGPDTLPQVSIRVLIVDDRAMVRQEVLRLIAPGE
jgi:hypothetical protein